jgi:GH43 family beta-xylosidase
VTLRNPIISGTFGDDHGDPFIVRYLDSYFLYHTGDTSGRRGVSVHRSNDLVSWEFLGFALEAAPSGWAWSDLWAPEVVYERGTFYMYVTATSRYSGRAGGRWQAGEGDDAGRRLGVARATDPAGPFVWDEEPLIDHWSIDGHPFRDDDGAMWLLYNVRNEHTSYPDGSPGTGIVCDRLLAPDRLRGRPRPVISPSQPWEGNRGSDFYWNEAPYLLKRRGVYHLMYSGGYFLDDSYAIGLAHSDDLEGRWTKDPGNPAFRGSGRIRGPGHHSVVFAPDAATRYAVYHGYVDDDPGRKVHIDRMKWAGDRPHVAGPTDTQSIPPGPVLDDAVPHWCAEAWVRGSCVEVGGERLPLEPQDVWHQIEIEQTSGRLWVRSGGVLRSSRATGPESVRPEVSTDGDVTSFTVSSSAFDAQLLELPARSTYAWSWGGTGRAELSLAVRGAASVECGDIVADVAEPESPTGRRFRLVELDLEHGCHEIVVRAGDDGAFVTDLAVHART